MPSRRTGQAEQAVRFLYGLQSFGIKLGLDNISAFLRELGDPQHALPSIHIAGTNGKGSTAALLASVLMESGYRTALYTSPHLIDFRERIRVQGRMVPASFVASWVGRHRGSIRRRRMTFFEATTALAFDWFRSRDVDIAVIETGLGGRLDATNVLSPLLTIITSISRDHAHILGHALTDIAWEKAGITKPGVPCVLGPVPRTVGAFLRAEMRTRGVPIVAPPVVSAQRRLGDDGRQVITLRSGSWKDRTVRSGLPGAHQAVNVSIVAAASDVLARSYGMDISPATLARGVRHVEPNTGLTARCAAVPGVAGLYVDVAHNPEAMRQTAAYFRRRFGRTMRVIFGISSDKDVRSVLASVREIAAMLTAVEATSSRRLRADVILKECSRLGIPAEYGGEIGRSLRAVMAARRGAPVLITGSHFVVGEALAALQRRKYLTITQ